MSASSRATAVALMLMAATAACFRSTAPPGFLPKATEAQQHPYGGWIRLDRTDGLTIEGELLAATTDTLHLFNGLVWTTVPVASVSKATLSGYYVPLGPTTAWAVVGGLSTISHGAFLILSAPAWIAAGTASASSASRAPRVVSTRPEDLRAWARFPQGPDGIDRAKIGMGARNP